MKLANKYLVIFLLVLFICPAAPVAALERPYVSADAAILMDGRTGQVLFAKNPHKQRPPASTTKILTALLALEFGNLNDTVTVSPGAARVEGSSIYLEAGEKLKLADLITGALMKSGNDACTAIAEHISGSVEDFAELMNKKAVLLGARNSHFTNPHGLPNRQHYVTAYDLGIIAVQALKNRKFADIVSVREQTIDWPGKDWDRRLTNTNELLWRYHWADGIKTGTTSEAGSCLVSSASKDNRRLVAVVLKSGNRYNDTIKLFEFGFAKFAYRQVAVAGEVFRSVPVQQGMTDRVPVRSGKDLSVLVPRDRPAALEIKSIIKSGLKAPVIEGQKVGTLEVFLDGQMLGKTELLAGTAVPERTWWRLLKKWWEEKIIKGISGILSKTI